MLAARRALAQRGGFTPQDLAGLLYWYDATKITGLANGATVSPWKNQAATGSPWDMTPQGGSVTYQSAGINGHPAVEFASSGAMAESAGSLPVSGPFSFCGVVQTSTPTTSQGLWAPNMSQPTPRCFITSGSLWQMGTYDGTSYFISGGTVDTAAHFVVFVYNGASSSITVDGVQVASGNAGPYTTQGVHFLIGEATNTTFFNGAFGELFGCSHVLSAAEQASLHSYAQSKWGTP